ncbi:hypothetical protein GCM10023169_28670 [Georgenia halophila]|uniref:Uncharacterized protein n=1 Tax=Georgenia halophila TaxID=620889 RepID=A0ABP8LGM4_9MICO
MPRAAWTDTLVATGLPLRAAELLGGLYEAGDAGRLAPAGDRQVRGTTPIEETLGAVLQLVA